MSCCKVPVSRVELVRVLIPHTFYSVPKTVTKSTLLVIIFSRLYVFAQEGVQSSVSISDNNLKTLYIYCIIFQFELLAINIKIRVVSISSYLELEDY